jgi:beta-N-acetylhexosaminidase|tara:strand:+ start:2018 stop:3091 length:1074 start_codon:yes stop_codon:yes gene_type:complete
MKSYDNLKPLKLGPIMCDIEGLQLDVDECEMLLHPLIGGVILFTRNYDSPKQLIDLTEKIHGLRQPSLLIAVDHEGGRIQRFHEGFSQLPACGLIGAHEPIKEAQLLSKQAGWLMATELLSVGIDFSFAPVLDVGGSISEVIGDRAFHVEPEKISQLAKAFVSGMKGAGMAAVGKHFPGHGSVIEDSHFSIPVDHRSFENINMHDLIPFKALIDAGISGLMPAHVIYSEVDKMPAGFSSIWIGEILRKQLKFQGTIFSDDLSMEGAKIIGDYPDSSFNMILRTEAALKAGCDMVLICNNKKGVISVLDHYLRMKVPSNKSASRLEKMRGNFNHEYSDLKNVKAWQEYSMRIGKFLNE